MSEDRANGAEGLACAVISSDQEFRRQLAAMLRESDGSSVALEVVEPFTGITDTHLQRLRRAKPDVVFVDLQSDPHVGVKFVQFLLDSELTRSVVGSGSADSPELLLEIMQAGVQDFMPKPLDRQKVHGVMQRLRRKSGLAAANGRSTELGRILSVFSPKGGTGSTTLAVNLAVAIHQISRKRTLLVDLDLELGETSLLLGVEPRFSSVDLVHNYHRVDEGLLASYIERDESGLDLLSAPYDPGDFQSIGADRVGQILGFLREQYDYVIVDAPKALNPVVMSALEASEALLLLCTPELQSLRNATRVLPRLQELGRRKPDDWIRPVLNRYGASLPISVAEVEKALGLEVYWTLHNDYRPLLGSINDGRPLVLGGGKSTYADDIRALASEVTGVRAANGSRSRLLGGLLSAFGNGRHS